MLDQMPDVVALPASALLVEGDPAERDRIRHFLLEFGVEQVIVAANGDAASKHMAAQAFDLVVMSWELNDLPGLALFNRIKATPGYATVPVLVTSRLLHKKDFELLREYPCGKHVEKPSSRRTLETAFFGIMAERTWYSTNASYVDFLLQLVDNDPKTVVRELRQLLTEAPEPVAVSLLIARALIDKGFIQAAQTLLERVVETAARSPSVLWQLARVHYMAGRPKEARQLLGTAERVATGNLERLCLQGEVSLTLHEPERARECFKKCLAIDGQHPRALAGQVLADNLEAYVRGHAAQQLPRSLAATCNLLGVSLAQSGKVEEGISQYQAALAFLGEVKVASRIAFNLGLGHLRKSELETALGWFRRAETMAGGGYTKAKRYRSQTEQALSSGTTPAVSVVDVDLMDERIGDGNAMRPFGTNAVNLEADLVAMASEISQNRKKMA